MADDSLSDLLKRLQIRAEIYTHAKYCGRWAVDTSGMRMAPFHLVQEGNCWLHVGDADPVRLSAGDLVVLPHDSGHLISSDPEKPEQNIVNTASNVPRPQAENVMLCGFFEFGSRIAWPVLDSLPDAVVVAGGNPDTDKLIELIFGELDRNSMGSSAAVEFHAHALFIHVLRAAAERGFDTGLLGAFADQRIGPVLARIHADPAAAWSLVRFADIANMGRSALSERFKSMTGESPMRYLQLWRFSAGKRSSCGK